MFESISGIAWVSAGLFPLAAAFYAIGGFISAYIDHFKYLVTAVESTPSAQKTKLSITGKVLLMLATLFVILSLVMAIAGIILFFQAIVVNPLGTTPIVLSFMITILIMPRISKFIESYDPYGLYMEKDNELADPETTRQPQGADADAVHNTSNYYRRKIMNITLNSKDRIYSLRGGTNSYGPYLDGRDIRDAFHYQAGKFYRQDGWDGKSKPKLDWEHSREQVEKAQTYQGWYGLHYLLERDDLNRLLYPLAKGDIGKTWTILTLPLVDELYGHLQLRARLNRDGDYLFFDDGMVINALKAYGNLSWNYGEKLQLLLEKYQIALQNDDFLVKKVGNDDDLSVALAEMVHAILEIFQWYGGKYQVQTVPEILKPNQAWLLTQQKDNRALWEKLYQQLPQFQISGVFHLATASEQHRCDFLGLLCTLATAEDCRDVWGYFHGHPLPHVRAFHQRLCVEYDGADYDDPIVQDALTRLMREAGMYGWLVMGHASMPEDADNWHSGFAYAETFEQALTDVLQWAKREREA